MILAIRFIVPLFIPRFPLPAILVCLVVDAADQTILQQLTDLSLDSYQNYDKALDIYYLTIAYLAVYRNWTNGIAVEVARFLWYYRLIGVLAFEITQERWLLMVFPNTFEYFFIAYEVVRTCWDPRRMSRRAVIGLAAFIWIFIKLPQEWWIHVAQNDFTDFMKETVFGVDGTDSWATRSATVRSCCWRSSWRSPRSCSSRCGCARASARPIGRSASTSTVPRPPSTSPMPIRTCRRCSGRSSRSWCSSGSSRGSSRTCSRCEATGAQIVGATIVLVLVNAGVSHLLATPWRRMVVARVGVRRARRVQHRGADGLRTARRRVRPEPGRGVVLRSAADDDHRVVRPLPRRTPRPHPAAGAPAPTEV